jgi:hypothetical protein
MVTLPQLSEVISLIFVSETKTRKYKDDYRPPLY